MLCALVLPPTASAGRETISIAVTEPQPATLTGDLYTPSRGGPHAAVILLHGCGGVAPNAASWAQWLQSEGYAALVLDSLQGRGIRTLCADTRPLTPLMRVADVSAAAVKLKSITGIDGDRLAVMGFSHGGATAIAAWHLQARRADVTIKAMIGVRPGCGTQPPPRDAVPLLLLVGGQDDWAPPENCQKLADAARSASAPVTLVLYPDARHGFDAANVHGRAYVSIAKGGKGATVEYSPSAHSDSEKQVKQFLAANVK